MGKAAIAGSDCVTNQQINSVVVDQEFETLFVYYNLSLRKDEIRSAASGSAQPIMNKSTFGRLRISVPDKVRQVSIASVLGALDDKIELNRRMNETLEAMARAIFKDWFVDFGPTRAKIEGRAPYLAAEIWSLFPDRLDDEGNPEGWVTLPLGELAKIEWGNTSLTKSVYVESGYPAFSAAGQDGFVVTPERKGLGVVISAIGTVGKIYLASGSWTAIKNTLTVQGDTDAVSAFVYYLLQETPLPTRGSTQQFISLGDAKAVKVISPDHQSILAFFNLVEPHIRRMGANNDESRTLAATRDFLLPRLMSGEVRVKYAEKLVGEAT
jgi:type I restriction enzyme S subunit